MLEVRGQRAEDGKKIEDEKMKRENSGMVGWVPWREWKKCKSCLQFRLWPLKW